METCIKLSLTRMLTCAAFALALTCPATAQIFSTLYNFSQTSGPAYTNQDGAGPFASPTVSGNTLYGTAQFGGAAGKGVVFKINTDGTGFTVLHSFTALSTNILGVAYNTDGAEPIGTLVLSGDTLFGTTSEGGEAGHGTVFSIKSDGTDFKVLHSFNDVGPNGDIVLADGNLYGVCSLWGFRTLFKLSIDGASFDTPHVFEWGDASPIGGLTLFSNSLYGVAYSEFDVGTNRVFGINTDTTNLNVIYSFSGGGDAVVTNATGASPNGNLTISSGALFGTTWGGGMYANGVVFRVNTDGSGFRTLHDFSGGDDGLHPLRGMVLCNGVLYGVAGTSAGSVWGSPGFGLVFCLNADGTNFRVLHRFNGVDGRFAAGLVLSGVTLFGITAAGGASGNGTIFSLTLQPPVSVAASVPNLVLSWPTNFSGFKLQQSTSLGSAGWTTYNTQTQPIITNGQFVLLIPGIGTNTQRFFRLTQ